jgi:hypothetical protein
MATPKVALPPVHHGLTVHAVGNTLTPETPPDLKVGDTVSYTADAPGRLVITFDPDSPLTTEQARAVVFGGETVALVRAGHFFCGCTLIRPDGTSIGWKPGDTPGIGSGGVHDVKTNP